MFPGTMFPGTMLSSPITLVLLCCLLLPSSTFAAVATLDEFSALGEKFDHLTTGYELTGEHTLLECGECHIGGVFETLPKLCGDCHDNVIAVGKPSTHISTDAPCDTCHNTSGFLASAIMDHSILERVCAACHDGISATGKSFDHINSTNACEACHTTNFWDHVDYVNHTEVLNVDSCGIICHSAGGRETYKSASHMITSERCAACHLPAGDDPSWPLICPVVAHTEVSNVCSSCHNGVIANNAASYGDLTHDADHGAAGLECNNSGCHTAPSSGVCNLNVSNWAVP